MVSIRHISLSLVLLISCSQSFALSIVRMEMQLGINITNVDIALYDDVAPFNVANFLGYVNRGDYDQSFFHRKVQSNGIPFVVQGGGYTYTPEFDPDARFVNHLENTCLLDFPDPVTGELGLRKIDEEYYVDANGDDLPDFLDPLVDISPEATSDPCLNLNFGTERFHPTYVNWEKRNNNGLQHIAVPDTDPVTDGIQAGVPGEASISNLLGTIAMALTTGPDTGSNEWFVNMRDNAQLDTQAGGFTVIGEVIGNGMDFFFTVNDFDILPIASTIHPALGSLPVNNLEAFALVLEKNLAILKSAREIVHVDITEHDFSFLDAGSSDSITITVSNRQAVDLVISAVGDLKPLTAPYSMTETCELAAIPAGGSCNITINFDPVTAGEFPDILDIAFSSPDIPNIEINLSGIGKTPPPRAVASTSDIDFEFTSVDGSETQTVTLTNLGGLPLDITGIASDTAAYTQTNDCLSVSLNFTETCTLDISFEPTVQGVQTGVITVISNDASSPLLINVTGNASDVVEPVLVAPASIDFGDTISGVAVTKTLTVANEGNADLALISVVPPVSTDYTVSFIDCGLVLEFGSSCFINVTFDPGLTGVINDTVIFNTDDPVEPEKIVKLTGTSSADNDNVSDAVEDAAPNAGDGDGDGVADSLQGNVVSIKTSDGSYITLAVPLGPNLLDVKIIDSPSSADEPAGVAFTGDYLSYEISGAALSLADLGTFDVSLILPRGAAVNSYYHYGPTIADPVPHWYEFLFDGTTGAQILNDVEITATDGSKIVRDMLLIRYKDGDRGDDDLTVNGSITSVAVVAGIKTSSDSGSMGIWGLFVFCVLLAYLRRFNPGGNVVSSGLRNYR